MPRDNPPSSEGGNDSLEFPDGIDPIDLPPVSRDTGHPQRNAPLYGSKSRQETKTPDGIIIERSTTKVPMLLSECHDPVKMISKMFDLAIAANAVLIEEFDFHEIYAAYIDMFRNDPDPKVRLAASDRLLKQFKDVLTAMGAVSKVTDVARIRSPDGTVAEREVVTHHVMRSFEKDTPHGNSQESDFVPVESPRPALPEGSNPSEGGRTSDIELNPPIDEGAGSAPVDSVDDSAGGSGGRDSGEGGNS